MKEAGKSVGIDFTGLTDRSPNTLNAHIVLDYVLEEYGSEKQNEVQERLFKGYFTDGIYPDKNALTKMAEECGVDANGVKEALDDDGRRYKVTSAVQENAQDVVGGVPFFIINGRPAFSGARDASTFHQVFDMLL
mmetsp:Transcript_1455/g.3083  ORF Transcript_1455/g.3083 Transcript_1455/m.3083 type:complete len:135 (+) Transcript_1455:514-918(+)